MRKYLLLLSLSLASMYSSGSHEKEVSAYIRNKELSIEVAKIPFLNSRGERLFLRSGGPLESFLDMVEMASAHGYEIRLNSAYRSYEHQDKLWRKHPELAIRPDSGGKRTHMTGCAVDIAGTTRIIDDKEYKTMLFWWLKRFGPMFGYYQNVEGEPWHYTYLGDLDDSRQ